MIEIQPNAQSYTLTHSDTEDLAFDVPVQVSGAVKVVNIVNSASIPLVEGDDYTVIGAGAPGGVTVRIICTLDNMLGIDSVIVVMRDTPTTQLKTFLPNGGNFSKNIEAGLDKLTMEVLDIRALIKTCLRVEPWEFDFEGILPLIMRKNGVVSFDADGNLTIGAGAGGSAGFNADINGWAGGGAGKVDGTPIGPYPDRYIMTIQPDYPTSLQTYKIQKFQTTDADDGTNIFSPPDYDASIMPYKWVVIA